MPKKISQNISTQELAEICVSSFAYVEKRFANIDDRFDRIEGDISDLKEQVANNSIEIMNLSKDNKSLRQNLYLLDQKMTDGFLQINQKLDMFFEVVSKDHEKRITKLEEIVPTFRVL